MFGAVDSYQAPPFWHAGPSPGGLYNFPGSSSQTTGDFKQYSQSPVTTATSLVAVTFDKGVLIAGDTLASYGSLARYRNCPRVLKVNNNIILGAGGDYADYQYVKDLIEHKIIDEECLDDGYTMKPKSLYCLLTRIMYNRRSNFNPFWNNFIVGGLEDGVPYLGTVDKLGTAYEDKLICTGYGAHIVLPLLRDAYAANPRPTEAEAKALVDKGLEILHYRDARSYPKYMRAVLNEEGITVEGPLEVEQNWSIAHRSH